MLIILLDEPGLFVFASAEDATREIEPIDAERQIRAAFDDWAVPYRVERLRRSKNSFLPISKHRTGTSRSRINAISETGATSTAFSSTGRRHDDVETGTPKGPRLLSRN